MWIFDLKIFKQISCNIKPEQDKAKRQLCNYSLCLTGQFRKAIVLDDTEAEPLEGTRKEINACELV